MLSYCLKCRRNNENKNPKDVKTKNVKIMLLLKYAVCGSKKSKFIKEQEAEELLSIISKIPSLGPLFLKEKVKKFNLILKQGYFIVSSVEKNWY